MDICQDYRHVEEAIAAACAQAGRGRDTVRLLAISKFQPAAAIIQAAELGQRDFGENYVQEALAKRTELERLPCELRWHMTGHIQGKKAARVAGAFWLIHTLDSIRLADALEKALPGTGARQKVLIEVNIANEPQKAGIMIADLSALAGHVLQNCPQLELLGLMCLPPVFDSGEAARPYFAKLRHLRDKLEQDLRVSLPELSMGMSGDFAAAIAEGATIVRIGTAIFGPRPVSLINKM